MFINKIRNANFLAHKTKLLQSAYISNDFCPNLKLLDKKGLLKKFYKILWDYIPFSDPGVLIWAGKQIGSIAKSNDVDIILGVASAGTHFAAAASIFSKIPFGYIRKNTKPYGLPRLIEGQYKKGSKALIVDNFVFTGGTIIKSVQSVKNTGLRVAGVVSIDHFDKLKKSGAFNKLDFISLVDNSIKIKKLISLNYFPKKIEFFIRAYCSNPYQFFEPPSKIYKKYLHIIKEYSYLPYYSYRKPTKFNLDSKNLLNFAKKSIYKIFY